MKASSDAAFRKLIERFVAFYRDALFNPHWGEQVKFHGANVLEVAMVFQDLDRAQAEAAWQPFLSWIAAARRRLHLSSWRRSSSRAPTQHLWDAAFLKQNAPQIVLSDDRPGAPEGNVFWAGNQGEAGWFLHGYESTWMPATLLEPARQPQLVDALFAASRRRGDVAAFQQGPGRRAGRGDRRGAQHRHAIPRPPTPLRWPSSPPRARRPFQGIAGHEPDLPLARRNANNIAAAMGELRKLVPSHGSYVSESNYFEADWQSAFWGANYSRLRQVKDKIRSRRAVLRPSRRRQRGLERRRLHAPEVEAPSTLERCPILGSVPASSRLIFW